MKFRVRIQPAAGGGFYAVSLGEPECSADGATREETLENIRGEIRYRQEFCPCSWTPDDYVELVVEEG